MKKTIALVVLLCAVFSCLSACAKEAAPAPAPSASQYPKQMGKVKSTDTYTENKVILWNDETQRKFECYEVVPAGLGDGEKVPAIVYIHGLNGDAQSLIDEPEAMAASKIAGFTFETGISMVDGKRVTPSHYTYRVSDFEVTMAYVKSLPYVDTSRIFIYGQSYGGLVAMTVAPKHNADTAGLILESTGLDATGSMVNANNQPMLEQHQIPKDWQTYVKQYEHDVIMCCSEGDTGVYPNGQYTVDVFNERSAGTAAFISCPEGKHSFAAFSDAGKAMTLDAMRDLVLGSAATK